MQNKTHNNQQFEATHCDSCRCKVGLRTLKKGIYISKNSLIQHKFQQHLAAKLFQTKNLTMADHYYGSNTTAVPSTAATQAPSSVDTNHTHPPKSNYATTASINKPTPNFTSIPGSTLAHSDSCKIFVGGLSWQTNEESLRWHFEQYGPVISVEVMRDRNTGDPRGFAFVVFESTETVDLVMIDKDKHEINHKFVDVKRAQARGVAPPSIHEKQAAAAAAAAEAAAARGQPQVHPINNTNNDTASVTFNASSAVPPHANNTNSSKNTAPQQQSTLTPEQLHCKIFVGGIPPQVDRDELYSIFAQYGTVIDAIVMMDPMNPMKSRCFGFVTFDPEQDGAHAAASAIAQQPIQIHGRNVEIKLATPRAEQPQQQTQPFRSNANSFHHNHHSNAPFVPPVAKNVGLRAGLTSSVGGGGMTSTTNTNSIYSGLAVAYGRNGWKAGYGSIAFNGPYGWNIWPLESQETTNSSSNGNGATTNAGIVPIQERIGFSFDMLKQQQQQAKVKIEVNATMDEPNKRARY